MGDETGIDLAPMLDFVLNLLIFFIITAVFLKEVGITVSRPNASNAEKKESSSIVVSIDARGDILVDRKLTDERSVRAAIERLHAQRPEDAVVVVADNHAPTGILVSVIDQVRQGGVMGVSIAASQPNS
ncbi:biopolymer transport protein ExbD [Solimonas aquatica]|uniref:Biopolymer transport protein ExbD n=1 Tax=Solimonas aquatica TaxID=489703 RepID=A0A1H8ZTI7_9GAMM|nr:biopolymer transporter ExbD [Solimonas aquatica]SEP67563.1 biopolymer transport protein ExbD [Solimonas aquatica]